jgi:hypothetical protein
LEHSPKVIEVTPTTAAANHSHKLEDYEEMFKEPPFAKLLKFANSPMLLPTLNMFYIVPVAFLLESAINVVTFMAVLVVTKQLDSAIDTVANFAGLMTILELDFIVVSFMKLAKVRSLKVKEKEGTKTEGESFIALPIRDNNFMHVNEDSKKVAEQTMANPTTTDTTPPALMGVYELITSMFLYLFIMSSVYLLL